MKKVNKNKGITLISLIVTLIILLILAGVTVISLTGENGLLIKAQYAGEKTKEAEAVEEIKLQLMSCRTEYILNKNMDVPSYVAEENKDIETQIDTSNNGDGTPLSNWLMMYKGYIFEIYDLQIQGYYKEGNKVRPSIKEKTVTEIYQFASKSGSKMDVSFKVELPQELTGATINVSATSEATGTVDGNYDNTTGIYTGIITTDGTINTNGTYTYEVKASKDGKEYSVKTIVTISKFLDNPKVEVPENDKTYDSLKIKITNNYPQEAGLYFKYYISETTTYGTEEFTTDVSVIKTGLTEDKTYNIKVEAYLEDKSTSVETIISTKTKEKLTQIDSIEDLEKINTEPGAVTGKYVLIKDLDFKDRNSYETDDRYNYYNQDSDGDGNPDNGWSSIGTYWNIHFSGKFNGEYEGKIHSISNLYTHSRYGGQALFYKFLNGAEVKNLKLINVDIYGWNGGNAGLVADNYGTIENVGVTGKVTSGGNYTGGICAFNEPSGVIRKCYAIGTFMDYQSYYHGIATAESGIIEDCYSIVTGYLSPNTDGIKNNYYLIAPNINCIYTNNVKTDITDVEQMKNQSTYSGWDFINTWYMDSETGYPRLQWEKK